MGYTYRNNGAITDFWPDDTENEIYIENDYGMSLDTLMDIIKSKWEGVSFEDLYITSENIHTRCLTYDCHDSSDWTQFIIISRKY